MAIIQRRELDRVLGMRWLLLYGRRKTGKTFYVRERGSYARYFVVTRGRSLVDVLNMSKVRNRVARGLAIGVSSHVLELLG